MAGKIGLEAIFDLSGWNSNINKYLGGVDKASSATNKAAGGMGKAWTDLGLTATKAAAVLGGAIVAASAAAGAAVTAFVVQGISKAADLEEGLSRIAAALNITMEEVGPLKELINNLGLDPNLKVTATEAALAIENLAKNGLSMDQILAGAARSTVLLANATGADFGQAADITTDVMQQFGFEAKDMTAVVDGITAVTNLSKFSIDDYALSIAQAGGVASSFGVSFDDFNTSIAATSPLFASGSDAGTSFKTFLQRLVPQTKDAKAAMNELGLEFFDSNGQMKSMAEVSTELNEAFFQEVTFTTEVNNATAEQTATKKMLEKQIQKTNMELYKYSIGLNGVAQSEQDKAVSIDRLNRQHDAAVTAYGNLATSLSTTVTETHKLTEEEKIAYATTLFGTDAMRTAFALAEQGEVVYTDVATAAKELGVSQAEVNKVIEGGVTQFEALQLQMAQVDANEQAATRMNNFKGALEILKGVIEAVQIQIGDAFLPILTELAKKFTELASQYGPQVVAYFSELATNIADLIRYVGEFLVTGQPFNQFFADLSPTLQTVVLGIGAFTLFVQQASDLIANTIGRFVEWKDVLIVLGAAIASVVIPAIAGMVVAMAPVLLVFGGAVLAVAGLRTAWENDFLGIKTATVTAFDAMKGAVQPLTDALKEFGPGALAELKTWATGNETEFNNVKAIWVGARLAAANLFQGIVGFATSNLPGWTAKLTEWSTAAGQWLTDASATIGTKLTAWYTALSTEINNKLPAWKSTLLAWATAAWQWLVDAAGLVGAKLTAWYTALSTELTSKLASWKTALILWANAAWQWIVDASGKVATQIGVWYTNLSTSLSGKLATWKTSLVAWATAAWQWLVDASTQVAAKVTAWYTALKTALDSKLPAWRLAFFEWTKAIGQWIVDAVTDLPAKIASWYTGLKTEISAKLPTFKTEMLKFATGLVEWIGSSAADALPHLGTWFGKVVAWIPLGVLALGAAVIKLGTALVSWIAGGEGGTSAVAKTDPEMEKFKQALITAIGKVWEGFKGFVQNFAQSFWDEINTYVDWQALGRSIINSIRTGFEALTERMYSSVRSFVDYVVAYLDISSWTEQGKTILRNIRDGFGSIITSALLKVSGFVADMKKKFTDINWKQLGVDIIQGIIDGFVSLKDTLIQKVTDMANLIPQWMKDLLAIGSPSKVMMDIGKDVMLGLVVGMQKTAPDLYRTISGITDKALEGFASASSVSSSFSSAGGGFASRIKEQITALLGVEGGPTPEGQAQADALQEQLDAFDQQKQAADLLKDQADLFALVQKEGGDLSQLFGGITVGLTANASDFLNIVSGAMHFLNERTDAALKIALLGYDKLIAQMAGKRKTVAEIEAEFSDQQISQLQQHRNKITDLDKQIADAEVALLGSGSAADVARLESLDSQRAMAAEQLSIYLQQIKDYQAYINLSKQQRKTVTDIEAEFADKQIDQLEQYKDHIAQIDKDIADTEASLLAGGDQMDRLKVLNQTRQKAVDGLRTYLAQLQQIERIGAQAQADDPILSPLLAQRDALLSRFKDANTDEQERVDILKEYTAVVQKLATIQSKLDQTDFLGQQQTLLENIQQLSEETGDGDLMRRIFLGIKPGISLNSEKMGTLYERFIAESMDAAKKELNRTLSEIEAQIVVHGMQYDKRIDEMRAKRRTVEQIEAQFQTQTLGGLEAYRKRIADLDEKIATAEANVLSTGSLDQFKLLSQYNQMRADAVANLEAYLQRSKQAERTIARIQTASNDRMQTEIDRFKSVMIDPLMQGIADFSLTNNVANLDNVNKALGDRVNAINAYIASADELADIENKALRFLENNDLGVAVEDAVNQALEALYSLNTSAENRENILTNLTSYISRAERSFESFNQVVGDDPLLGKAKESARGLLMQLLNINLSTADRIKLTTQYNAAIANMLALETKQGRLNTINDRISLIERVRTLATDLKDGDLFARVFSGVDLTKDLSAQDLATVLSRYTDEAIRLANKQLSVALTPQIDIQSQLDTLAKGRRNFDAIMEGATSGGISQLEEFRQSLERYDTQIAELEKKALETGSQSWVDVVATLTKRRAEIQARTEKLASQMNRANRMLDTIATTNNEQAAAVAESFRAKYIDPMIAQFDAIGSDAEKEGLLGWLGARINTLNRYLAQVNRLDAIKKDVSGITGFNPLVAKWEETHLDTILDKIYDINTAEAQRNVLIEQYRAEQEKLVKLQEKQQQLEFLQQQLALVDQIKQMNDEFDDLISVQNILSGITFGVGASLDDMLLLTSRTIDAMILTVKRQLGIASPSKVMAKIGEQMMKGLGIGIRNTAQYPTMAMAGANQSVPYALTNSRTMNVNMGGVSINNGMDDVMFEARIRQIVEGIL